MVSIKQLLLLTLAGLARINAQIPAECVTDPPSKQCCPDSCSNRGSCTDIRSAASWDGIGGAGKTIVDLVESTAQMSDFGGRQDIRYEWPTRLFTHVCKCDQGYGGANCSDCDFGYEMDDGGQCKKADIRFRRNFLALSSTEKSDIIEVLNESKNEDASMYRWAVVTREPDANGNNVEYTKVSTYDLFVYHHFLSKREGDLKCLDNSNMCSDLAEVDFAHEGPAFLTWHRYYLLLVEREFGRIAERLKSNGRISSNWNRYNFALPYWDWSDSSAIFNEANFGSFNEPSSADPYRAPVMGSLFDKNNWQMVCDEHYEISKNSMDEYTCSTARQVCNPVTDRTRNRRLERGLYMLRGSNETDDRMLPDPDTIRYLFKTKFYDAPCESKGLKSFGIDSSGQSFRNRVEGFVNLNVNLNSAEFETCGEGPHHNNFHNAVHIYIHGHMRVVPSASNDPIFYLHHNNIERIFQTWIHHYGNSVPYRPMATNRIAHPGHNAQDYLVPFFPLKTNQDMWKHASHFGFRYDALPKADLQTDAGFSVLHSTSLADFCLRIAAPLLLSVVALLWI